MAEQKHVTDADGHSSEPRRVIVISVDGSDHADHAVNWYLEHIRRPNDRLVLAHVPELTNNSYDYTLSSTSVFEEMRAEIEKSAQLLEEKYTQKLLDNNVKDAEFRIASGHVGEKLVEIALDENAALVLTGCRGLGTFRRTLLGSVSDYILHHCHCPVIVCRH